MSIVAEDISVELDLDTKKFEVRLKSTGALLNRFDADIDKLAKSVNRTEKHVTGLTARMRDWVLIIGQARNALNQISFLTYDWAAAIVKSNADIERMTYLIKGLSDAADEASRLEDAKKTVEWLFDAAANAPFSVNALTDTFVKFKAVGLDPTNGSMQALVDATAAFGGTDQTLHRASIAIQQMAGKGVISMEELRQQLGEAVPQAINLMARSLGTSYGQLVKEISKGTVAAEPAIKAMLEEFERTFGGRASELMNSFSGQYAKMITNIRMLTSQNAGINGFFEAVKDNLRDLNEFLESPAAANFATTVGQSLETVVNVLRTGVDWFVKYQSVIVAAGKAIVVYWGANKIAGIVSGMTTLAGSLTRQITLWRTLRSAQMQSSLTAVQSAANFTSVSGAMSRLTNTGTGTIGMLRTLGRGFVSILGPVGFAVSAIWTLVDVLGVFKSKHSEVLDAIMEGQEIANQSQRESALKALDEEKAKIDKMIALRNNAQRQLEGAQNGSFISGPFSPNLNGAANQSRVLELKREIESLNAEIETAQTNFAEMREQVDAKVENFDTFELGKMAGEMIDDMEEAERKLRDEYNKTATKIIDEEGVAQEEKAKSLAENQQTYYKNMIGAWRGFIEEHKKIMDDALADGDTRTAEAAERAISAGRERVANLQRTVMGLDGMGIPTVETDEPSGTEKTALGKFDDLVADLNRESEALKNALVDPFAQEIPTSIAKTERKLRDLAEEAPQLADQIEGVLNAVKGNEGMKALLEMQKANRKFTEDAVSNTRKRQMAREEEVKTYESKKAALQELGQWTEAHEKEHQRVLRNINRQTVEDVEATLDDRKEAYDQNQIDILSDETLSHDERTAKLLEAEEDYYTDAIGVWKAFMAAQNVALAEAIANGDLQAVAIIQNALGVAKTALAETFGDLRSTQFNISGGSGGANKAEGAIERFNELLRDTKREADEVKRALADPFAYEIPDSIQDTQDKLNDLAKDAPQLKARMEEVMAVVRETEAINVLIDLRDQQREITKDIAGTVEARKMEEREQVKRLENMKQRLIEFGMWSQEHEKQLQQTLALIREQGLSSTPMGEFVDEWKDFSDDMESATVSAIKSINSEITNMIVERTADLESLRKSLLSTLINTGLNTGMSALMSTLNVPSWGSLGQTSAKVNHAGGAVGAFGGRSRSVPMSTFAQAERYHTGGVIGANEVPIIAERGESVLTKEQMKAIGKRTGGDVKVNIINNSGAEIETDNVGTRFDMETFVTDIVLKKASQPGKFRDTIKGK